MLEWGNNKTKNIKRKNNQHHNQTKNIFNQVYCYDDGWKELEEGEP